MKTTKELAEMPIVKRIKQAAVENNDIRLISELSRLMRTARDLGKRDLGELNDKPKLHT